MHFHHFCVIFSFFTPVYSYEDYAQVKGCCTLKGPGFKDIEYIILSRFKKHKMMEYNSTRGNWTGFTVYSIEQAKNFNSDPADPLLRGFEKKILCTDNIPSVQTIDNLTVTPTIKMNSVIPSSSRHPAMVVCSAYNFFPKQIRVSWLRNGQVATSGVSCSEVMSDGNWYYQIHCYLEYTPALSDKIACMVEHFTLSEPVLRVWDPSLPEAEQNKIVVGMCGLILSFVFLSSGFIYYKKKSAAYITVCQGQNSIAVEEFNPIEATTQTIQDG
ncbi:rano class II histocompatibility antigen, A beta chain-like [Channa argus]|uniref:rano class II histocompatibility antigen, A beta chain-like n=1 Tax=Channa argus TaxID=215402 RepID=UPI003523081B